MSTTRILAAGLSFGAAALVGLALHEQYTDTAVVPTQNDRPTVGFGSTFREDGAPVQMGDKITPPRALARTFGHIQKDEAALKKQCIGGIAMSNAEYDIIVDFTYQYGVTRACESSMVARMREGDYTGACEAYTLYRKSGGYDCSTLVNGQPNRRCWGVWQRNLDRRNKCLEAQ